MDLNWSLLCSVSPALLLSLSVFFFQLFPLGGTTPNHLPSSSFTTSMCMWMLDKMHLCVWMGECCIEHFSYSRKEQHKNHSIHLPYQSCTSLAYFSPTPDLSPLHTRHVKYMHIFCVLNIFFNSPILNGAAHTGILLCLARSALVVQVLLYTVVYNDIHIVK